MMVGAEFVSCDRGGGGGGGPDAESASSCFDDEDEGVLAGLDAAWSHVQDGPSPGIRPSCAASSRGFWSSRRTDRLDFVIWDWWFDEAIDFCANT